MYGLPLDFFFVGTFYHFLYFTKCIEIRSTHIGGSEVVLVLLFAVNMVTK